MGRNSEGCQTKSKQFDLIVRRGRHPALGFIYSSLAQKKERKEYNTYNVCMYVVVYNIHIFYTFLSVAYIRRYKRSQ